MSALAPSLSLDSMLDLEPCCRFCGCTEESPCPIYLVNDNDIVRLARSEGELNDVMFCSWYVPGVCNSPLCIEKLLEEKRGKVLLFDAQNHPLRRAEGR